MATKPKAIAKKAPEKKPVPRRVAKAVAASPPEKPALGRETKRTPELEKKLFEALVDGCTRRAACAYAGIAESTLYEWLKDFPEFSESLICAENQAEAGYTRVIAECARNGDWKAAESWLKRRRRDDWADNNKTELSGALKVDVSAEELTDDELAAAVALGS